jgi:Divergent InlB B-repeat domain
LKAQRHTISAAAIAAALIVLALALPGVAFAAPDYTLEIEYPGGGEGEVACKVDGGAPETCEEEYEGGTALVLVPYAEEESVFAGWSAGTGSAAGCAGTGSCAFALAADSTVAATFEPAPEYGLTVNEEGEGYGEVECKLSGEPEPEWCQDEYPAGQKLTLIATADPESSKFAGWSNGTGSAAVCNGKEARTCAVTLEAGSEVDANFALKEFALSIGKKGTGSGSWVCETEEGIEPCAKTYKYGAYVYVIAKPAAGSKFGSWQGCDKVIGEECEVEIEEPRHVVVTFEREPEAETPEEPGGGGGSPPATPGAAADPPPLVAAPVVPGIATAAAVASVKGARGSLRVACAGGPCGGAFKLTAKVRRGKRSGSEVVGRGAFDIAAGASSMVAVKIANGQVRKLLKQGKAVKTRLTGTGIRSRAVKLEPAKRAKKVR